MVWIYESLTFRSVMRHDLPGPSEVLEPVSERSPDAMAPTCIAGCRCPARECPRPPVDADPGPFHPRSAASPGISHQSRSVDLKGIFHPIPQLQRMVRKSNWQMSNETHQTSPRMSTLPKLAWIDGIMLVASPSMIRWLFNSVIFPKNKLLKTLVTWLHSLFSPQELAPIDARSSSNSALEDQRAVWMEDMAGACRAKRSHPSRVCSVP